MFARKHNWQVGRPNNLFIVSERVLGRVSQKVAMPNQLFLMIMLGGLLLVLLYIVMGSTQPSRRGLVDKEVTAELLRDSRALDEAIACRARSNAIVKSPDAECAPWLCLQIREPQLSGFPLASLSNPKRPPKKRPAGRGQLSLLFALGSCRGGLGVCPMEDGGKATSRILASGLQRAET